MKLLLTVLFLTAFSWGQDTSHTHKLLLMFNEPMSRPELFDKDNYTVFDDSLNEVNIREVGVVQGDTAVVLFVDFLDYKTDFAVRVFNVTDTAGNTINPNKNSAWFYFDGFDPTQQQPVIIIK